MSSPPMNSFTIPTRVSPHPIDRKEGTFGQGVTNILPPHEEALSCLLLSACIWILLIFGANSLGRVEGVSHRARKVECDDCQKQN